MIDIAISLLWFLIAAIILCGVVWLVLYGIKNVAGLPIPPRLEQGIWFIVLLLVLIWLLLALTGRAPFRIATPFANPAIAALSASAAAAGANVPAGFAAFDFAVQFRRARARHQAVPSGLSKRFSVLPSSKYLRSVAAIMPPSMKRWTRVIALGGIMSSTSQAPFAHRSASGP